MLMKKIIFSARFTKKQMLRVREPVGNIVFIIFLITLFAGIITGAIGSRFADSELAGRLDIVFLSDFRARSSHSFSEVFVASFASAFIFMTALYLSGLSLWGGLISAVIPFIKGYGYGISVGYLYGVHGFYGILYNILVILPGAFVCSAVICAAAREAFLNSFRLVSMFRKTAVCDDPRIRMKNYFLSMLWLLFLAAAASVADMLFSLIFSGIFTF